MKIISVILARGGSKGILNKNIIDINGKPLLAYVISESIKSKSQETWVSTDSERIKEVACKYGAQTLDRPKNISGDFSQSEEVVIGIFKFGIAIHLPITLVELFITHFNNSPSRR